MEFRRKGACDQRRRRVLIEENLLAETEGNGPSASSIDGELQSGPPARRSKPYADAALADRLPPITAVIPRRAWTLVFLTLVGLAVIAGLEAVYGNLCLWPRTMWPSEFAALDIEAPGGLAAWFSSLALATAALQGVQIYRMRRHKTDDYRGRYRMWLWMPAALLFMAACVATHVHQDLMALADQLSGVAAPVDRALLWPLGYCIAWVLLSVRLAFEMRACPMALASLGAATGCYFGATIMVWIPGAFEAELVRTMATTSIVMLGHLATFVTIATYGRHVYLEAQDLASADAEASKRRAAGRGKTLPPKTADHSSMRAGSSSDPSRKEPQGKTARTGVGGERSEGSPAPRTTKKSDASPRASLPAEPSEPEILKGNFGESRKLSKAERRRLRKQQRRERARKAA